MRRPLLLAGGVAVLALAWAPGVDGLLGSGFPAHMARHMAVVALAAPLLALGIVGGRFDPSSRVAWLFPAIPVSLVELFVVWGWHAPAAHDLARSSATALAAEQGMFLVSGLWLWIACFGHAADQRPQRTGAGVLAMLLTTIHMTLLGVLLAVTTRPLYGAHHHGGDALDGQHVGGVVMLLVGGAVYLAGGVALARRLLGDDAPAPHGDPAR